MVQVHEIVLYSLHEGLARRGLLLGSRGRRGRGRGRRRRRRFRSAGMRRLRDRLGGSLCRLAI
jgi:hypothetical protein